ncbi:hypothetical protein [Bradyrhizobium sp.]|uniref:hypothetical protein n=1 Tax=Bradyrhizobium sp. TaxID=376 RepID=UPI003C635B89
MNAMPSRTMLVVEIESLPTANDPGIQEAILYVLCEPSCMPAPGIMITGVGGEMKSSERWPFFINKDGRGDWGAACEDEGERFFETNMRGKPMKVSELLTVKAAHPDWPGKQVETTFRIRKTTAIAGPVLQ